MAVAAGVVADAGCAAVGADVEVAAQSGGSALLDGAQRAEVMGGNFAAGAEVVAIQTDDVGQLESGPFFGVTHR